MGFKRSRVQIPPARFLKFSSKARGRFTDSLSPGVDRGRTDRKSTRLNSSHLVISYAVFCLKKHHAVPAPLRGPAPPPDPAASPVSQRNPGRAELRSGEELRPRDRSVRRLPGGGG